MRQAGTLSWLKSIPIALPGAFPRSAALIRIQHRKQESEVRRLIEALHVQTWIDWQIIPFLLTVHYCPHCTCFCHHVYNSTCLTCSAVMVVASLNRDCTDRSIFPGHVKSWIVWRYNHIYIIYIYIYIYMNLMWVIMAYMWVCVCVCVCVRACVRARVPVCVSLCVWDVICSKALCKTVH